MIQARICSYYKSHCCHSRTTPITFPSLPEQLRDRVYRDAGVINGATLRVLSDILPQRLSYHKAYSSGAALFCARESHGVPRFCVAIGDDEDLADLRQLYFDLRITSSWFSVDMARFLYSHNCVLLCCEDRADLNLLLHLSPTWFCSLQRLTIHLGLSKHDYSWGQICSHEAISYEYKKPRRSKYRTFNDSDDAWRNIVKRLASVFVHTSSKPKLEILCDTENADQAWQLVQPLTEYRLACRASAAHPQLYRACNARSSSCVVGTRSRW